MYHKISPKRFRTTLLVNKSVAGKTIEKRIEKMMQQNQPIEAEVGLVYAEGEDTGIHPAYDIRTDRFELALKMKDTATKTDTAKAGGTLTPKKGEAASDKGADTTQSDGPKDGPKE